MIYIPLPFKDAAVLLKAQRYGVGYEAAAVVSFVTQCRLKQLQKAPQFDLDTIIKLVTDKTSKAPEHVGKLFKAQELFQTLAYNLKLRLAPKVKSHLRVCPDGSEAYNASVEERLAVAFLGDPERLLWCDEVNGHGPSFLGEPVVDLARNGCFVAVLLAQTYSGLKCFFSLPATQWVLKTSGVQKPEKTARIIGDSTLMVFRKECCNKLRQLGYDVKVWRCKGGATEQEVAVSVAITGQSDLCIAIPNGNRLGRQSKERPPSWINEVCESLCAGLKATARRGVIFVGDAELSPGVAQPEVYQKLVPVFQQALKEVGLPVIGQIAGLVLAEDGIHWSTQSRFEVEKLMEMLSLNAVYTEKLRSLKPPELWHWKLESTSGKHFPACIPCGKLLSEKHLTSKQHIANTCGVQLSFYFPRHEYYQQNDTVLYVNGNPKLGVDKSEILPACHPFAPENIPGSKPALPASKIKHIYLTPDKSADQCPTVPCITTRCRVYLTSPSGEVVGEDFVMPHGNHGKKRSVFCSSEPTALVVKCELLGTEANRNKAEHQAYLDNGSLRGFVPQVHGYFEQPVGDQVISMFHIYISAQKQIQSSRGPRL